MMTNTEDDSNELRVPETLGEEPPRAAHHPAGMDARLQKIADYEVHALAHEDLLEANLASVNAGLMRVTTKVEEFLTQSLAEEENLKDLFPQLQPGFDTFLRLTRQIERYAQLGMKSRQMRQAAPVKRLDPSASLLVDEWGNGTRR